MAKVRKMYQPLAKWSGAARRVRMVLPQRVNSSLYTLLIEVAQTHNLPLDSAPNVARCAAQTLATEMMRRPAMSLLWPDNTARLTVPESEALTLLAWMLSSPSTNDTGHSLRPLMDALHKLLN